MSFTKTNLFFILLVSVVSFAANVAVFLHSYRRLAFPYLNEEQRVANAEFIMSVTVVAFAVAAALTGALIYWLWARQKQ